MNWNGVCEADLDSYKPDDMKMINVYSKYYFNVNGDCKLKIRDIDQYVLHEKVYFRVDNAVTPVWG